MIEARQTETRPESLQKREMGIEVCAGLAMRAVIGVDDRDDFVDRRRHAGIILVPGDDDGLVAPFQDREPVLAAGGRSEPSLIASSRAGDRDPRPCREAPPARSVSRMPRAAPAGKAAAWRAGLN